MLQTLSIQFDEILNKRPPVLNGHLNIRDSTPSSSQKDPYLHINSPIIEKMKKSKMAYEINVIIPLYNSNQFDVYCRR